MRYPDWFRAQVVQAVTLHGLSYTRAAHLYDVADETIRKWANGAAETPAGLDRLEALEHRVAQIEHYLVLAEAIRHQGRHEYRPLHPVARGGGHDGFDALHGSLRATAAEGGGTRS
jgi:hypothetical protein